MPDPLAARIAQRIDAGGPISVAEYMAMCLSNRIDGYYVRQDPFGAEGDFITAPEISQLFGELIGAWLVDIWQRLGSPDPVQLVELGPGRGTLMSDIMRVAAMRPAFRKALNVNLVEISPALKARQEETLAWTGMDYCWFGRFSDVPPGPILLVANEFFDALPVHQYVGTGAQWRERLIGRGNDGGFAYTIGKKPLVSQLAAEDGAILETCPAARATMGEIAGRIGEFGGAALIIDYGYEGPAVGETLQAVRKHEYTDPLAAPGNADLTAHVDFAALKECCAGAGVQCHGPMDQGDFLLRLGLLQRAGRLGSGKDAETRKTISAAVEQLAGPQGMGQLFKMLAVTPPSVPPAPFATD